MNVRTHKDLEIWQSGIDLVVEIYKVTNNFPKEEVYALTSQLRRASVSVPSNIAEGGARDSNKEFLHFLSISLGSLAELETQVIIAERLGYLSDNQTPLGQIDTLRKRINAFVKHLKKSGK